MTEQIKREEKDILKDARKKLGLTQQQVADKANIAIQQYQMFEGGKRRLSSASFHTASKILRALELDVTAFARGEYALNKDE